MQLTAHSTSVSLLAKLTSGVSDSDAWARFVFLYGPQVVQWCRRHGLQDADAHDVAQDVMVQLSKEMKRFHYDPNRTFRGWLRAVVHSAWCDWVTRKRRWHAGSGDSRVLYELEQLPAREELMDRLEQEYERELFQVAVQRVRSRVEPHTWEAFRLLAIDGLAGKEAAEKLGMKLGSAFAARSKVQRLLREEVEKLDLAQP